MKIIKVNKAHILNEDVLSVGYSGQGYNTSGFSYSIMPLQFNLNQKGNDAEPSIKNKAFKFLVGDMVKGFCPYDNKKHKGIIKYMYYTVENNESPKLVYIQDLSNNIMVPLTPDTLVKIVEPHPTSNVGTNYLGSGSSHVGYDLDQYSPVKESIDFNKLIQWNDDNISFNKSDNNLKNSSKKSINNIFYDFLNCKFGDKIYYDKTLGYNLLEGDYIGFCCIEAGQLDNKPRFAYKENLIGEYTWRSAIEYLKTIKNCNCYLPSLDELNLAFTNCKFTNSYWWSYWSSTEDANNERAFSIRPENMHIFPYDKTLENHVRPFIHISQLENKLYESFDFNKELLKLDSSDNIEFIKTKISQEKIGNISNSFLIENLLQNYLDNSSYIKNMRIVKINDSDYYITPNNAKDDPVYGPLEIRIKDKKLDMICKNHWAFNMDPTHELFDFPEAINQILRCGITFNSLTLRDVDMTLRNSHRFFLYYGELLKYDQLPKKIIIEDTALRHKHNISHYSFTIIPYDDPDGNFNIGKYFDIEQCIKIKNWLNHCGVNMVVFHPDMITKKMYGELYCNNYKGNNIIDFDILNITKQFYNKIIDLQHYRLIDINNDNNNHIIKYQDFLQEILQYIKNNKVDSDEMLIKYYTTPIAYFMYNTKIPFYLRSEESYSMYNSFTLEYQWGYPNELIEILIPYIERVYGLCVESDIHLVNNKIQEIVNNAINELYEMDL